MDHPVRSVVISDDSNETLNAVPRAVRGARASLEMEATAPGVRRRRDHHRFRDGVLPRDEQVALPPPPQSGPAEGAGRPRGGHAVAVEGAQQVRKS